MVDAAFYLSFDLSRFIWTAEMHLHIQSRLWHNFPVAFDWMLFSNVLAHIYIRGFFCSCRLNLQCFVLEYQKIPKKCVEVSPFLPFRGFVLNEKHSLEKAVRVRRRVFFLSVVQNVVLITCNYRRNHLIFDWAWTLGWPLIRYCNVILTLFSFEVHSDVLNPNLASEI